MERTSGSKDVYDLYGEVIEEDSSGYIPKWDGNLLDLQCRRCRRMIRLNQVVDPDVCPHCGDIAK